MPVPVVIPVPAVVAIVFPVRVDLPVTLNVPPAETFPLESIVVFSVIAPVAAVFVICAKPFSERTLPLNVVFAMFIILLDYVNVVSRSSTILVYILFKLYSNFL